MAFIKQDKTNWKYILIVVILAMFVGGGILIYQYRWMLKEKIPFPPISKKPALLPEVYKKSTCYCSSADDCYKNYDVKTESQFWECSENKCFYQCIETAPIQFSPGVEGMTFCMSVATSIGWPPPLKGGKIEDNSALLEWSSVSEENAMEFNAYRRIASQEDIDNLDNKILSAVFWKREIKKSENLYDVIKNENATLFIDRKIENGKTYLYAITGTDRFCSEGNFFEFFVVSFPNEIKIWKGGEMATVWKVKKVVGDETADWKTYRNEEYGFEVKYPKEYSFSEKPKELLMKDYSPYYPYSYEKNLISDTMFCYDRGGNLPSEERVSCDVRILVYQNPKNLSVRDFFEEAESIIGFGIQTEKDIVLGNQINAKKFIFGKGYSSKEIIAVEKEEKIIAITGPLDTTTGLFISVLEYSKDFDSADTLEQALLSTFRFLE